MDPARWISLVLAAGFCLFAYWLQPSQLVGSAIIFMLFPMVLIWYGDELAAYSEWQTKLPTPAVVVKILAWILFSLTPLVVYIARLRIEITQLPRS
jgi:hypothetical protein